jgi:hypothetical protein
MRKVLKRLTVGAEPKALAPTRSESPCNDSGHIVADSCKEPISSSPTSEYDSATRSLPSATKMLKQAARFISEKHALTSNAKSRCKLVFYRSLSCVEGPYPHRPLPIGIRPSALRESMLLTSQRAQVTMQSCRSSGHHLVQRAIVRDRPSRAAPR